MLFKPTNKAHKGFIKIFLRPLINNLQTVWQTHLSKTKLTLKLKLQILVLELQSQAACLEELARLRQLTLHQPRLLPQRKLMAA